MYFYIRYLFLFFTPYKHKGALPKIFGDTCGLVLAALHDTFWPVFLLRRGLRQGKDFPAPKYRHLMTYYDNRFAQDMGLCLRQGPL